MTALAEEAVAGAWPRDDPDYRFRLYRRRPRGHMVCWRAGPDIASCMFAFAVAIEEGDWGPDDRPGLLDTMGEKGEAWVLNPFGKS